MEPLLEARRCNLVSTSEAYGAFVEDETLQPGIGDPLGAFVEGETLQPGTGEALEGM